MAGTQIVKRTAGMAAKGALHSAGKFLKGVPKNLMSAAKKVISRMQADGADSNEIRKAVIRMVSRVGTKTKLAATGAAGVGVGRASKRDKKKKK